MVRKDFGASLWFGGVYENRQVQNIFFYENIASLLKIFARNRRKQPSIQTPQKHL
jgi:hypothetical protein